MSTHAVAAPTGRRSRRKLPEPPKSLQEQHVADLAKLPKHWTASWADVLKAESMGADVIAGITVAAVALPLNLALAVASGLPPEAGLLAGAIGGGLAAAFGGAPLQVTGPAAALNVLVLAIATDFGPVGVAAAALMIGVLQILAALTLAGRLAKYVPEAVLAGFTTGVGVKLFDQQVPELLGFDYKVSELAQMMHRPDWLHEVSWISVVAGLFVAMLVVTTQQYKRFPAALVGIVLVTALSMYVGWKIQVVGAIPSAVPPLTFPVVPDAQWLDLFIKTLPLALLAAVESLLSAKAVDRMSGAKVPHDPNLELIGQGIGNIGAGLFSGMPVTGVIVRSGVNVQSGGRTRLSALVHAGGLMTAMLLLHEQIAKIPLAALAGLLLVIATRLIEVKTLIHLFHESKVAALAFLVTCVGTLTGWLMTGLVAGLAVCFVGQKFTKRHEVKPAEPRPPGVRAILKRDKAEARRPPIYEPGPDHHGWLDHVREEAHVARSAYVHRQANVAGRVVLGEHVHIAAGSSVRADEGTPFFIGSNSNVQDGVVIHALKEKKVLVGGEEWAVYIGRNVSMAHDALVHGPCYVGDDTFIGFKAVVHDSVVGAHCFIGIGSVVVGVEIPDGKFVPHGSIIDTADKVAALPDVSHAQLEFNEDVVDVNRGLARAYQELDRDRRTLVDGHARQHGHSAAHHRPASGRLRASQSHAENPAPVPFAAARRDDRF